MPYIIVVVYLSHRAMHCRVDFSVRNMSRVSSIWVRVDHCTHETRDTRGNRCTEESDKGTLCRVFCSIWRLNPSLR